MPTTTVSAAPGQWKRTVGDDRVTIEATLSAPLDQETLRAAADRYGEFLGLPATVTAVVGRTAPQAVG
ncbi:hypothetical protein [Planosporangium mesophilum]|uniref:Uncharacterized protein n=1 Tax=Planosporangium mesophilum TaxID=689768 RepID=A0A8J3TQ48_9ACTN|nr:hypothetical protein [Planosporangium mesophilum]NJC83671.1 hypothetical protein [Planosporangium mesophilum]GII25335.1 hypothetical protein Pme01_49320 [Planosporangium mesophilum]